jgi:serine protease Do
MRKIVILLIISIILPVSLLACTGPVSNIDWSKVDQKAMLATMNNTFVATGNLLKPSILYIEMYRSGSESWNKVQSMNGVVLKQEGYILISGYCEKKDFDRIKVFIDEIEYPATIIDADKEDGITIIKVETDQKLTPAIVGDSNKVTTGQYLVGVDAMGKDAFYEKAITIYTVAGKIEARSDRILVGQNGYVSRSYGGGTFVVNLEGQLIGTGSGSEIMAFNEKKKTADRLIARSLGEEKDIEEQQPWEGFYYGELTKEYAQVWGFPPQGVLVGRVYGNSAAGKAGLKREDVIIAVDDQPIVRKEKLALVQFQKLLDPQINRTIKLKILRDSETRETLTISFKLEKKPKPKEFTADDIGIQVREITEMEVQDYSLFISKGALITNVIRGSSAATSASFGESLLNRGDVISEFYGVTIENMADFTKAIDKIRTEKPTTILAKIQRGNKQSHICLNLEIGKRNEKKD